MGGRAMTGGATRRTPSGEEGFTLVEILVVLAIIGTLVGLVSALIPIGLKKRAETKTRTLITSIGTSLEGYKNDEDFGRYPPTRTTELKWARKNIGQDLGQPNTTNVGIETVYIFLDLPEVDAAQVTQDPEQVANTDGDKFRAARGRGEGADAREFMDSWGRPLVYFNAADYKEPKGLDRIKTVDGEEIQVHPKRLPSSMGGGFVGPTSFQLFSLGENGVQDDGEESDDIVFNSR